MAVVATEVLVEVVVRYDLTLRSQSLRVQRQLSISAKAVEAVAGLVVAREEQEQRPPFLVLAVTPRMEVSAEAVGKLPPAETEVQTDKEELPLHREVGVEVDLAAVLLSACCIGGLAVWQDPHHQLAHRV